MMQVGTSDIMKYPFLHQAGEYLKGIEIKSLGEDSHLIEVAMKRLTLAAEGNYDTSLEQDYMQEIKVFALELLMCRYIGIPALTRKFALAEARRVEEFLEHDIKSEPATVNFVVDILRNEFGLQFVHESVPAPDEDLNKYIVGKKDKEKQLKRLRKKTYGMTVPNYLMMATKFKSEHWKLINQVVHRGYVWLDSDKIVRMARNTLQQKITEKITEMKPPALAEFSKHFQMAVRYMNGELTPLLVHKVYFSGEYPPCIRHVIDELNKGQNVPHSGRLLLAMYMVGIGREVEDIVSMFKNAPDFNDKKTRYHVESLTSKRSGHDYSVMGCMKIKEVNLCFPDAKCENIRNPMQYGRPKGDSK